MTARNSTTKELYLSHGNGTGRFKPAAPPSDPTGQHLISSSD
ncbi:MULTISPECIES: hypothetical protein [Micromonospora]